MGAGEVEFEGPASAAGEAGGWGLGAGGWGQRDGNYDIGQDWVRSLFRGAACTAAASAAILALSGGLEREHGGRAGAVGREGRHRG